jgi:hypothetical protein
MKKELNLNKEYLNYKEATEYMCMSERGFRRLVKEFDIPSGKIPGGKIMFRRIDLKRLVEAYMNAPENMFPPYWDK